MTFRENKAKGGGICVANHTSPIDVVILGCDNTYAMVSYRKLQTGYYLIVFLWQSRTTATLTTRLIAHNFTFATFDTGLNY